MDGHKVLAVVPARGGSKSIPRKNLAKVAGISLVGRAARIAASLDWVDQAIVSTDDEEIAWEANRHGIEAPFLRPDELAGDLANSIDMWRQAWLAAEAHYQMRFELSILLEPTSPLRRADDITRTVRALLDGGHKAAATVCPTPAHFTPHKTLTLDRDGVIGFYLPEGSRHSLRQTIPSYYHRNGICYAVRRPTLVDEGQIIEDDCLAVVIDRPVVNIDEPFELELAEWLLAREEAASGQSSRS
ncbi:MAG: acylneuraminate cytidylyltransferase family protein [Alphaproteobacteria bacterium]|nr:acylneuraminate cytidylyltransferase family protein [Alphaproteobacteria bacterium]MDP6811865.1 acylneuraminate cytidylyltransferase family protein [Alphaproteobacteria bacterium]